MGNQIIAVMVRVLLALLVAVLVLVAVAVRVFAHPPAPGQRRRVSPPSSRGSLQQAQQLAIGIVSTFLGERPLAPTGIFDPVAVGTSTAEGRRSSTCANRTCGSWT